jgi:hypothetical protein
VRANRGEIIGRSRITHSHDEYRNPFLFHRWTRDITTQGKRGTDPAAQSSFGGERPWRRSAGWPQGRASDQQPADSDIAEAQPAASSRPNPAEGKHDDHRQAGWKAQQAVGSAGVFAPAPIRSKVSVNGSIEGGADRRTDRGPSGLRFDAEDLRLCRNLPCG